jgi:V8-like Glu-specific endopeptidase
MRNHLQTLLLLSLASACGAAPEDEDVAVTSEAVRDATPVPKGQLLGMVIVSSSQGTCSGMVIARDTVLTAGHCFCTQNIVGGNVCATRGSVKFQDHPSTGAEGPTISGSSIIHPGYDPSGTELQIENDLAIVKLDGAVPGYVTPFVVATNHPPTGATVKIVGYGHTGQGCSGSFGRLNYDHAKLDAFEDDHKIMRFNDSVTCNGDSGGAVMNTAGTLLHGVHSNGVWTPLHGSVSKSMVTSTYFSWIKANTCSQGTNGRCSSKAEMCRCPAGIGDCDSDGDCNLGLKCRANVGSVFGYGPDIDVCLANGPLEGTCSCQNSGAGNICTAGYNACSAGFVPRCNPQMGSLGGGCGGCSCQ